MAEKIKTKYEKGKLIIAGKTKEIYEVLGRKDLVIMKNKDDITAFDDPKYTKTFSMKAVHATTTTSRVFEFLKKAGTPVAHKEQISSTEIVAKKVIMIPIEFVIRRFAVGSFLKRHPELTLRQEKAPLRFHRLKTELFLKTTKGKLINAEGDVLVQGLDPQKGEEDPFIVNPYDECWNLYHPKKPAWEPEANMGKTIMASSVIPELTSNNMTTVQAIQYMESVLREVFLVLEGAFNTLGIRLIDMKIEFGVDENGKILVADVIDNDSWRLRDKNWQELSKQAFRDGEDLDKVKQKYGIVASLVERFRIPEQALVIWRGSEKDDLPKVYDEIKKFINVIEVVCSGHKKTNTCLKKLNEIIGKHPEGGVLVMKVGRSNGLSPITATHTTWPVIVIPATLKSFPNDIWSSIRMPSLVPLATAWPEGNAIRMAINILAAKNPALYMWSQKQMEELDQ